MKDSCPGNKTGEIFAANGLSPAELFGLFHDVLNRGLGLRIRATGTSMMPFLSGDETLVMRKVDDTSLRKGDLIFFRGRDGIPVLHRVVRRFRKDGVDMVQTRGDALILLDDPIPVNVILCRVSEIEGKRYVNMETMIWRSVNYLLSVFYLVKSRTYLTLTSFKSLLRSAHR
ncbi:MAG TPA: hypothetical protein VN328_03090 [Thermodesulfovibrionales bacterium]|nr:hypothetical protein [Thermodesulfovibrionales bacterium]